MQFLNILHLDRYYNYSIIQFSSDYIRNINSSILNLKIILNNHNISAVEKTAVTFNQ